MNKYKPGSKKVNNLDGIIMGKEKQQSVKLNIIKLDHTKD